MNRKILNLQQRKFTTDHRFTTDNEFTTDKKFTTEDGNPKTKLGDRIPENKKKKLN